MAWFDNEIGDPEWLISSVHRRFFIQRERLWRGNVMDIEYDQSKDQVTLSMILMQNAEDSLFEMTWQEFVDLVWRRNEELKKFRN